MLRVQDCLHSQAGIEIRDPGQCSQSPPHMGGTGGEFPPRSRSRFSIPPLGWGGLGGSEVKGGTGGSWGGLRFQGGDWGVMGGTGVVGDYFVGFVGG